MVRIDNQEPNSHNYPIIYHSTPTWRARSLVVRFGTLQSEDKGARPKGLVGMPPKAYRWVDEMKEIAIIFYDEGSFERDLFSGVCETFRFVANETVLNEEKTEDRELGKSPEDVSRLVAEGVERKKMKVE